MITTWLCVLCGGAEHHGALCVLFGSAEHYAALSSRWGTLTTQGPEFYVAVLNYIGL